MFRTDAQRVLGAQVSAFPSPSRFSPSARGAASKESKIRTSELMKGEIIQYDQ